MSYLPATKGTQLALLPPASTNVHDIDIYFSAFLDIAIKCIESFILLTGVFIELLKKLTILIDGTKNKAT